MIIPRPIDMNMKSEASLHSRVNTLVYVLYIPYLSYLTTYLHEICAIRFSNVCFLDIIYSHPVIVHFIC